MTTDRTSVVHKSPVNFIKRSYYMKAWLIFKQLVHISDQYKIFWGFESDKMIVLPLQSFFSRGSNLIYPEYVYCISGTPPSCNEIFQGAFKLSCGT